MADTSDAQPVDAPDPLQRASPLARAGDLYRYRAQAPAMKIVAVLAMVGLAVAIIGGIAGGDIWFRGGEAVFFAGVLVLCLYSLWKRRQSVEGLDVEEPGDEPAAIDVPRAEQELKRKDRGTVPTTK